MRSRDFFCNLQLSIAANAVLRHVHVRSLQVFTSYKSNPLLREMIEFACRQFYILHRKPFLLQLFASVAPLLEISVRVSNFGVVVATCNVRMRINCFTFC